MSFRCPVCKTLSFNLIRPTCDRCKRRMVDEDDSSSISDLVSDIASSIVYSSFSSDSSSSDSSSSDSGSSSSD